MTSRIGGSGFWVTSASGGGASRRPQPVQEPSIVTEAAVVFGGVTTGSGTLRATLYAQGWSCSVYWRYRELGGQWLSTQSVEVPAGGGVVEVASDVSGLVLSADYECRASCVATSGPWVGEVFDGGLVGFTVPGTSSIPPSARTVPATLIGGTTARLNGRVNPRGTSTSCVFQLTDLVSGAVTTWGPIDCGAGVLFVDVSADASGLTELRAYQYVVVATNAAGQSSTSEVRNFSTIDEGSAPFTLAPVVTSVTDTTALATAAIQTNGLPCQVLFYYRNATTTFVPKEVNVLDGVTSVQATLDGMPASTAHFVKATIASTAGFWESAETGFSTGAAASSPIGYTMLPKRINSEYATLQALFDPNGVSTTVTFEYYKDGDVAVTQLPASATSGASVLTEFSARATSLQSYSKYWYRARATNAGGTTYGDWVAFKTKGLGGTYVSNGQTDPATFVIDTQMQLNGTITINGVATTWYFEYWVQGSESTTKKFTDAVFIDDEGIVAVSPVTTAIGKTVNGLIANTTYEFRVACVSAQQDTGGEIQYSSPVEVQATAVAAPYATGLMLNVTDVKGATALCSGACNPQGASTTARFEISASRLFGSLDAVSVAESMGSGSVLANMTPVTITGLVPLTRYFARVRFVNASGTSYSSNIVEFETNDQVVPTVTTNAVAVGTITANDAVISGSMVKKANTGDHYLQAMYGTTSQPTAPYNYDFVMQEVGFGDYTVGASGSLSLPITQLTSATPYYVRFAGRNDAGVAYGSEVTFTTDAGSGLNLSDAKVAAAKQITPYSFHMHGTIETNGDPVDVVFEYICTYPLNEMFASPRVRPTQTIADSIYTQPIADRTDFLPGPANGGVPYQWQYRIKTTQAGEVKYSDTVTLVTCPAPVLPVAPLVFSTVVNQGASYIDAVSARPRFDLLHNGKRTFMYMEWGTTASLGTVSRWVSYDGPDLPYVHPSTGAVTPQEMHYADYLDNLTPSTTYFYKLHCWSVEGIHSGPITSFTTAAESATPSASQWANSWVASVGTQLPQRNVRGPIPRDLRLGTETRTAPSSSTSTAEEVVWGDDVFNPAGLEVDYTILVTPLGVTGQGTHPIVDKLGVESSGSPNITYALRGARVGDIIRVDGSYRGFQIRYTANVGAGLVVGSTYTDSSGTWQARCVWAPPSSGGTGNNAGKAKFLMINSTQPPARGATSGGNLAFGLDIFLASNPANGVSGVQVIQSGPYVYFFGKMGGDGANTSISNDVAYWGGTPSTRRPITGVRIQAMNSATRFSMSSGTLGIGAGGYNGLFMRYVDIENGAAGDNWTIIGAGGKSQLGGVFGMSDFSFSGSDPYAQTEFGAKFVVRMQHPCCPDFRRGTYTPSNEHFLYGDSFGEGGNGDWFVCYAAITGVSGSGQHNYCQRSQFQVDARGDEVQASATGPGYAPGRGTGYIIGGTHRGQISSGAISVVGHFGKIVIKNFTHNPITVTDTRQTVVVNEDPGKGMWRNEHGFATNEVDIDDCVSNAANQDNAGFYDIRCCETVTIRNFSMPFANNARGFSLFDGSFGVDNGTVTFSGPYLGTGLEDPLNWPSGMNSSNWVHYRSNPIGLANFPRLEAGYKFEAMQ